MMADDFSARGYLLSRIKHRRVHMALRERLRRAAGDSCSGTHGGPRGGGLVYREAPATEGGGSIRLDRTPRFEPPGRGPANGSPVQTHKSFSGA